MISSEKLAGKLSV